LRIFHLRLIARHLPFGLNQLHLERPRIDLRQQFAAPHELPFLEEHPHQLAVHPALHRDGVHRDHRTQTVQVDINFAGFGCRRHDRRAPRPHGGPLLRLAWLRFTGSGHQHIRPHGKQAGRTQPDQPSLQQGCKLHGFSHRRYSLRPSVTCACCVTRDRPRSRTARSSFHRRART
jgi:hypothetical protein